MRSKFFKYLLVWLTGIAVPAFADTAKVVPVAQGGPFVSSSTKIQQFRSTINADTIDSKTPLTLTVNNGALGQNPFQWLRVFITDGGPLGNPSAPRGQMILNENNFRGSRSAILDLTGQLKRGNNYLLITGAGMPGAAVNWTLTSVKGVAITSVDPNVAQAGAQLQISGSMFSSVSSNNAVVFSQKYARPLTANVTDCTESRLKVVVPTELKSGPCTVQVTTSGQQSNPLNIEIRGVPEMTGVSPSAGPVGTSFTISGNNFPEGGKGVTVGMSLSGELKDAISCAPTAVTKNSVTVTMPQFPELGDSPYFYPPRQISVFIKVDGVQAKPKDGWIIYCARAPW